MHDDELALGGVCQRFLNAVQQFAVQRGAGAAGVRLTMSTTLASRACCCSTAMSSWLLIHQTL